MEINASTFKAQCLKLLDLVDENKTDIVVTKRGRPVARLVPYQPGPPKPLLGRLEGMGTTSGDIISPTEEEWSLE